VTETLGGDFTDAGASDGGLTAVLPCFNEGSQIERAVDAICSELGGIPGFELLVVDDGSTDDTLDRVRRLAAADPRIHYLSFTRNYGLEAAHGAGFRYASQPWLVQLDADLQSPPAETWRLLAEAATGGFDVVFADRVDRHDPGYRRFGSAVMHLIAGRLLGIELPRRASTFRVMRTAVARTIAELGLGSPYTIAIVPMLGVRWTVLETEHQRRAGRSRWRVTRLAGHAFELFFGYSWRPLNAVYLLAALATPVALGLAVADAAGALPAHTLAAAGLALGAVVVASLAVVARYLYRLMLDLRRPRAYYIREANVPLLPEDTLDRGAPWTAPPLARRWTDAPPEPASL
jgi:polyisoprenyl-phosphate glycosyltransferase